MGIADIVESALTSFSALTTVGVAELFGTTDVNYALNKIDAKNWKLDMGYVFDVEGGGPNFQPFPLQLNPTAIEQGENFAVYILPTQTGTAVEHQGFILKDLVIRGTTGIQPRRGEGGVTGSADFGTGTSIIPSGVPIFQGGKSGYLEFHQLRNYFRSYVEYKKRPEFKNMRLVFRNKKDNEHWYVEPVGPGFAMSRSAAQPMMYEYIIRMRIIGKAARFRFGSDSTFGQILDRIQQVEDIIDDVSNTIAFVGGVISGSVSFLEAIERNVAITLVNPIDQVGIVLGAMKNGVNRVSALPRTFYSTLRDSFTRVGDNFADLIGLGSPSYDRTYGRIPTPQQRTFVTKDVELLGALHMGKAAMNRILATDSLFSLNAGDMSVQFYAEDLTDAININQAAGNSSGGSSDISAQFGEDYNFDLPSNISEEIIEYGETLESFSRRVTGDPLRFGEIILLNNLDPPYVSETSISGKRTVKSGDRLLVPASGRSSQNSTVRRKSDYPITRDLTVLEKELGVDLKLTKSRDLAVNTTASDLSLIAGGNNAAQAVGIKIGVERGSLMFHPEVGITPQVGRRNETTAEDIVAEMESSITSDPRFLAVKQISVTRQDTSIILGATVLIRNVRRPVPLKLDVRNSDT